MPKNLENTLAQDEPASKFCSKNINPKKENIDKDMNFVSSNPRNALNKKS